MTNSRPPLDAWRPSGLRLLAGLVAMAADGTGSTTTLAGEPAGSGAGSGSGPRRTRAAGRPPVEIDVRDATTGAESLRIEGLVALAQAGDTEAFGLLYEHYVDSVYRYIYSRVGQPSLAEDLTAETFLRALRRLDSFSWQGRDIAAWFVTIARNLITDHRRSSRYRLEVTTDELLTLEQHQPAVASSQEQTTPEDQVLSHSRDHALVEAVRRLRPDQQECVVLRFFHDFTIAQTALALGRTEGAVKQLQLRAVRALAEILEEQP